MNEAMYDRVKQNSQPKKKSELVRVIKQLSYNRGAMVGLTIFLLELVLVLLAPVIAPYDYTAMDPLAIRQAPSMLH